MHYTCAAALLLASSPSVPGFFTAIPPHIAVGQCTQAVRSVLGRRALYHERGVGKMLVTGVSQLLVLLGHGDVLQQYRYGLPMLANRYFVTHRDLHVGDVPLQQALDLGPTQRT